MGNAWAMHGQCMGNAWAWVRARARARARACLQKMNFSHNNATI